MNRFYTQLSVFNLLVLSAASALAQATAPLKDTPFTQEYHEEYALGSSEANDVRSITFDRSGQLWAATGAGVWHLRNGVWSQPAGGAAIGAAHSVCCDSTGTVWIGAWNGLFKVENDTVIPTELKGSSIGTVRAAIPAIGAHETLYVGGAAGIWIKAEGAGDHFTKINGTWQSVVRSIMPADARHIWIGSASGLYLQCTDTTNHKSIRLSHPSAVVSSNITSLAAQANGDIVVASTGGLDFYRASKRVGSLTAKDGMPYHMARSVTVEQNGRLWIGTAHGVIRYQQGSFSLRHSRRWLLNDDVRDVAIGSDGTAWVATASGVDAIRKKQMTLREKADYFLVQLRARHLRSPGLIGPAVLVTPGDLTKSFIEDDDNDGEHTGMYLAMESMRYAVTKDPAAKANAKVAFHALMVLQQATGTSHFIARSVMPVNGPVAPRHEVDRTFTPEELAEAKRTDPRAKSIDKRWLPTADGKWLWKRDASSDEIDGHMFGYSSYFDLAADEDEKKLVADQVDRIIGGIIDHGYLLTDIDGKGTQWGNWSPESMNGDANWHEERAGNCVEMIAYLGAAYNMTHKQKYVDSARFLISKHGYDKNMLQTVFDTPSERTHIEDELLSITYPYLIQHLIFPSLVKTAQTSIQNWHKSAARDGIPFYDFVYNRYSGKQGPLDRAVETLRDWPLSHIEWTVDNSHREDVHKDLTPGLDEGFLNRLVPRSEMGLCMWDQEPYKAVIGNGGQREDRQNDWLLAYWMGRFYGLLGD